MAPGEATHPRTTEREPEFGHDALIVCDNLLRIYQTDTVEVQALQGLDLLVHDGEMIAIVGASGSGKSTLLQVLAGVDAATAGRARVAGHDLLDHVAQGTAALPPPRGRVRPPAEHPQPGAVPDRQPGASTSR